MPDSPLNAIAEQIKAAREAKALSQRALAAQVGMPQSHISRIENGSVDLQVSNLIQIARALDLELIMIPRNTLPAIAALRRRPPINETPGAARNRSRLNSLRAQAIRLARRFPQTAVLKRLPQTILELRDLPLDLPAIEDTRLPVMLEEIGRVLRELSSCPPSATPAPALIKRAESLARELRSIRDAIVHGQTSPQVTRAPAYTLDDNGTDSG
jgi:transcriptional regulator with XRE-family HTH domain